MPDFEGAKHTCAAALASHNARRRVRRQGAPAGEEAGDEGPRTSPGAALAASGLEDVASWLEEHAPTAATAGSLVLISLEQDASPRVGPASAAAERCAALASASAAAAAAAAAAHGCTVHIKLPAMRTPAALPSEELRAAVAPDGALFYGALTLPTGTVRPGCVLLTLDALVLSNTASALGGADAARAAATALAPAFAHVPGGVAGGATVHVGTTVAPLFAPLHHHGPAASPDGAAFGGSIAVAPCAVALEAASSPQEVRLRISLADAQSVGGRVIAVHARLRGHALPCDFIAADAAALHSLAVDAVIRLPAGASSAFGGVATSAVGSAPTNAFPLLEGALLVELLLAPVTPQQPHAAAAGAAPQPEVAIAERFSRTAAVLLCADAAAVAQVAASGAALTAAAESGSGAVAAALNDVLRVVGAALAPAPAPAPAPRRVRCAAAAAAWCLGWDALLTRLLAPTPSGGGGDADDSAAADSLAVVVHTLHAASLAGIDTSPACSRVLAAARARAAPESAWRRTAEALAHATHVRGHARPECAAVAAEEEVAAAGDAHAMRLVRAIRTLVVDAVGDEVAHPGELEVDELNELSDSDVAPSLAFSPAPPAAGLPADWPDADEWEYRYWLGRANVRTWVVVSALQVANAVMKATNVWRFVLLRGTAGGPPATCGVFSDAMLLVTRLYRRVGGPASTLELISPWDVPWPAVVSHSRVFFAATLLWRLPICVAGLLLALRWSAACNAAPQAHVHVGHTPPPRYPERLLALVPLSEALFLLFTDLLIMHATGGAAPDWPPALCAIEAVAQIVLYWRGPWRPIIGVPVLLARAVAVAIPLLAARAWAPLLSLHSGAGLLLAAFAIAIAISPARGRAMRAEWAAARAAGRAARAAEEAARAAEELVGLDFAGAKAPSGGSDKPELRHRKPADNKAQ